MRQSWVVGRALRARRGGQGTARPTCLAQQDALVTPPSPAILQIHDNWAVGLRQIALLSNATSMDRTNSGRRPSFFWQGLMIILPVLVLAVVGLYSLRQDEQAAEQAARKRAADSAQSLARAVGDMAGEELSEFLNLQNVWMIDLNLNSQPRAGMSSDNDLEAGIAKWERTYPGLKLAALAEPQCDLLTDGREIAPPSVPATPSPPKWYCELSPRQREL